MAELKPGNQLASTVCETRVVVVRADAPVDLWCGGAPMVPVDVAGSPSGDVVEGHFGPTAIGKRYVNAAGSLELLCSKGGAGALAADGERLAEKAAKPLPSSD
jgi:hypothetical protein